MHWSKPILFGNYTLDWHFLLLIICCVIGCWILTKAYQNRRQKSKDKALCRKNMHAIDHMTGEEFEALLAAQFRQKGFRAETTPKSKDYGADLVMRREKKNRRSSEALFRQGWHQGSTENRCCKRILRCRFGSGLYKQFLYKLRQKSGEKMSCCTYRQRAILSGFSESRE